MVKKRDYKKEYREFHGLPEQKKERASRNKARRQMEKEGVVHKGDGFDIDHEDSDPLNDARSNLRKQTKSRNRSRNKRDRD